jgi:hypothetical protein
MKTIIRGEKYIFYVVEDGFRFYIKALHLASSRFSFINNLNIVLSEFNIGADNKKGSESQWIISKRQSGGFFKKATGFLLGESNRNYIEKRLDEDRGCGEWENYENS